MKICFEITVLALLLLAELLIGNVGLNLGLTAFALFYFSVTISMENALFGAVICGCVLDGIYGRPGLFSPLILIGAVLGGWALRRYAAYHLLESMLPGVLIGEVVTLGGALAVRWWGGAPPRLEMLIWQTIFNGALGLLLMPALVAVLDYFATVLRLNGFMTGPRSRLGGRSFGARPRTVNQRIVVPRGDRRR